MSNPKQEVPITLDELAPYFDRAIELCEQLESLAFSPRDDNEED